MIQLDKILFPTDFSSRSDQAFEHALFLAKQYGAELHLLHVIVLHEEDPYNPAYHFPDEAGLDELEKMASEKMQATVSGRDHGVIVKHVRRRDISAAPAIVAYAEEEDVDLVVMGTHGRRGVRRFVLGSVTEEVVRTGPCAVLAVHAEEELKPLSNVNKILAPVDFSDASSEALTVARNIAGAYGAELDVVHVIENTLHPAFYNMGAMSIKDLQPDIEERTMEELRNEFDSSKGPAVDAHFFTVFGTPAREIAHFAETHDTDIVVISTHGLGSIEHFFMGSVAEKVVRRSERPVLVVKSFGKSIVR